MADRLAGKVALVTGAGGGQGRAAAIMFAREGARIVAADVNAEGGSSNCRPRFISANVACCRGGPASPARKPEPSSTLQPNGLSGTGRSTFV